MKKIAHISEVAGLNLPQEVIGAVLSAVTILDEEYGEDRNVDNGDGGYVLIIEKKNELKKLKDIGIDVKRSLPEYVDRIRCDDGQIFISTMVMLSDDFSIIVIMSLDLLIHTNWTAHLSYN